MAGLKEIRTRISSITSTQKITSAMKMVSAAKFHKAQETFSRFKPYSRKVQEVLSQVSTAKASPNTGKWFSKSKDFKRVALVVVTSNSSMCAGFNQNLLKKVMEDGPTLLNGYWGTSNLHFFCIGKKGGDFFRKKGFFVALTDSELVGRPSFSQSSVFCQTQLLDTFSRGDYDAVFVAYNVFKNPAQQEPVLTQFLPFVAPKEIAIPRRSHNIVFEPNQDHIMSVMVPMALKTFFHEILLENSIGEHGARMTAMHQATENANELIKSLKLQYNKARQAAITKEILEIVSGAEALKG